MKTCLYRHFDAAKRLLYVGITNNPLRRMVQHEGRSHWFRQVASITMEWHADRNAALAAERRAIVNEKPLHNTRLVTGKLPPAVAWGVLHIASGRFDGWYFRRVDGLEMLQFFRDEFPGERFAMVSRTEKQPAFTGRQSLKPHLSHEWLANRGAA